VSGSDPEAGAADGRAGGAQEAERTARIRNRDGLHARPAAEFVKLASTFQSEVWVEKDGMEVNGKSIMGVLMLAAEPGSRIRIRTVGSDAERALEELLELVHGGFGEELAPEAPGAEAGEGDR
jgi:phosphocarrier protein